MDRVHLECTEGNHYKFWLGQIETQNGVNLVTRWGRIGTFGQSKVYNFSTIASAQSKLATLVQEKLNKGYRQVPQTQASPVTSPSPNQSQPDGTTQAVKLLIELAILHWSSDTFVQEILEDAKQLAPHLNWTINNVLDLKQLLENL